MSGVLRRRTSVVGSVMGLCLLGVLMGCGSDEPATTPIPDPTDSAVTLPFAESFDAGPEAAAITSENSVFNVVENEPATFEISPPPVDGGFVGRYESTGDNVRTKVEFTGEDGVSLLYERVYLWVESYPSEVMRFLTFETSPDVTPPGEDVLALRMDPDGLLEVYNGAEFIDSNSTSSPLPTGEWVRLEAMYDANQGEHGVSVLRLFSGDNVDGTEPDETVTVEHVASPTHAVTTAAFGVLNFVDVTYSLDAIEASDTDWVGPAAGE